MKTTRSNRRFAFFALAGAATLMGAIACSSSNNNPAPTTSGTGATNPVGSGPSTSTTSSGATTTSGTGGTSSTSGTTSSGAGTGGGSGATCYDGGSPMTNDQFLNGCGDPGTTCQVFDTSMLTGLTADGGLPPLP